ncbi:MAG: hypothetical protein AB7G87_02915 [Clostridia bacterium]
MTETRVFTGCMVMVHTVSDLWDLSKKYSELRYLASDINHEKELKETLPGNSIVAVVETSHGETKFFFENKGLYMLQTENSKKYRHIFEPDEEINQLIPYAKLEIALRRKGENYHKLQNHLCHKLCSDE